jgi:integrase
MLTIRKRKGSPNWYIGGTVRVGKEIVHVAEYSTGTGERHIADAELARLQHQTEYAILHGRPIEQRRVGLAEAFTAFKARGTHRSDVDRMAVIYRHFGDLDLSEITPAAFERFCTGALPGRSPNTLHRYRTTLIGMFKAAGVEPPGIASKAKAREIVAYLPQADADRLIAAYSSRVRPIAMTARYAGLRAQELARLRRGDLDMAGMSIAVRGPKNGRDRHVPLHPRLLEAIRPVADLRAPGERLFQSQRGGEYEQRGNPWQKQHATALERAGIAEFRFHDWRHHWATWCVRPAEFGGAGMDLPTLMRLGGWSSLALVQRYAAASVQDRAGEMLARIA